VTVRGVDVNWSEAWTVNNAGFGPQGFAGVQLPLKLAVWPIARFVGKRTVNAWPLTKFVTVTPTRVVLPQLVTVPVKVIKPLSPTPPAQAAVSSTQGWFTSVFTPWKPPPVLLMTF